MYQIPTVAKWTGVLALAVMSVSAFADALPTGTWKGSAQAGDKSARIEVTFKGEKSDVHFGSPYSCRIGAEYTRKLLEASVYTFNVSNGGGQPCDNLSATAKMEITQSADKKLHLGIEEKTKDGLRKWRADLDPATP